MHVTLLSLTPLVDDGNSPPVDATILSYIQALHQKPGLIVDTLLSVMSHLPCQRQGVAPGFFLILGPGGGGWAAWARGPEDPSAQRNRKFFGGW
jgi:hypothetical protein